MRTALGVLLFCAGLFLIGTHPEYGIIKGARAQFGCGIGAQGPFSGCGAPAANPVFTATDMQAPSSSGTTITFSSVAFGTAASGRIIIAVVETETTACTGLTIGGVSATKDIEESSGVSGLQIWHALVPTGTSNSVVLTAGGSMTQPLILVGNAVGLNSATPTGTNSVAPTTTNPISIPTTVSSGGFAIDAVAMQTATPGSWTNATQIYSLSSFSGSVVVSNAKATASATVTVGNSTNANVHAVWAAWR